MNLDKEKQKMSIKKRQKTNHVVDKMETKDEQTESSEPSAPWSAHLGQVEIQESTHLLTDVIHIIAAYLNDLPIHFLHDARWMPNGLTSKGYVKICRRPRGQTEGPHWYFPHRIGFPCPLCQYFGTNRIEARKKYKTLHSQTPVPFESIQNFTHVDLDPISSRGCIHWFCYDCLTERLDEFDQHCPVCPQKAIDMDAKSGAWKTWVDDLHRQLMDPFNEEYDELDELDDLFESK